MVNNFQSHSIYWIKRKILSHTLIEYELNADHYNIVRKIKEIDFFRVRFFRETYYNIINIVRRETSNNFYVQTAPGKISLRKFT